MRLNLDRYMLELNALSSSNSWVLVKAVRMRLEDGRSSEGPLTPEGQIHKIIYLMCNKRESQFYCGIVTNIESTYSKGIFK